MSELTPIRVRGKRGHANQTEPRIGKFRRVSARSTGPVCLGRTTTTSSSRHLARGSRRPRRLAELSKLEQLPTEVLEKIFLFSNNVDLPLASLQLSRQLASKHSRQQLTSRVLAPILGGSDSPREGRLTCSSAVRLMNSRFFTWSFCRSWLEAQCETLKLSECWKHSPMSHCSGPSSTQRMLWIWKALNPPAYLPPPTKLLHRPFTEDSGQFLKLTISTFSDSSQLDADYLYSAQQGLREAIADAASDILDCFWTLGVTAEFDLLRAAVVEHGCEVHTVTGLVKRLVLTSAPSEFLRPDLWAWADGASREGNERGQWLKGLLRDAVSISRDVSEGAQHVVQAHDIGGGDRGVNKDFEIAH